MSSTPLTGRTRIESMLRTAQWICAWVAVSVPVVAALMSLVAVLSDDAGWSMVTALLVMPVAILCALLFGTITVVLSIILRVKYAHRGFRWVTGLVLGIVALVLPPIVLAVLVSTVG